MTSSRPSTWFRSRRDAVLNRALRCSALCAGAIVLLILVFLAMEAWPALWRVGLRRFFTDPSWYPAAQELYGLTPMLSGTLYAAAGAVFLATPLAIGSAVFLHDYAPAPIAASYRRLIELLAGIPSVVYGLWGLVVLAPLIGRLQPPGTSLLTGILILALMVLPTVALTADAALAGVPACYRRAAAALGLSRWRTVVCVVLPAARSGLYTGILLASGRALGETMAVLMVCGNVVQVPGSLFDPVRTLTANIALEIAYAMGDHRAALFVSGLLLMALVVALVTAVEFLGRGRVHV